MKVAAWKESEKERRGREREKYFRLEKRKILL